MMTRSFPFLERIRAQTHSGVCAVSRATRLVQLTGKVDVVRTAPSLAVSGGED